MRLAQAMVRCLLVDMPWGSAKRIFDDAIVEVDYTNERK